MKRTYIKRNLKNFLAGTLGLMLFLSSSSVVKAATSDQVPLSVDKPGAGYVNTQSDPLRIRKEPSETAEIIGSLPKDSKIMIVERGDKFDKIQYDTSGNCGYVASRYIREYDLEYYGTVITTSSLNIRSGSDFSYGVVAYMPSQANFPILEIFVGWDYIVYGNVEGYVYSSPKYIERTHY